MHSLDHAGFSIAFNSDLSGMVKIFHPNQTTMEVPGELFRSYIRRYVLGKMRDELNDVLYRQLVEWGGKDNPDYAFVLEQIDFLTAISTMKDPTQVLHGQAYLFGQPIHVTFLRVSPDPDGKWMVNDPAYIEELNHVEATAGLKGKLNAIEVPGFLGKYIAYTYPYTE